jgi:spore germination cell wall hydrolase CwlJ-like protein
MTKRYHPAREPSLRETLRHDLARAASESGWPEVSWTVRSLIAAGMVAVCVMMTAMSATATVKRNEAAREAQVVLADEAKLVAEFADYLAAETQNARAALDGPSLKPAVLAADFATEDAPIADLVEFDFAELPRAEAAGRERKCLAEAIYYEARSESRVGQLAVADVILNRVKSPVYPDSICGVVYQGSKRRTGCQFSFTCDGSMRARVNQRKMREADLLAGAILAGVRVPVSRSATHYHADYVSPPWADRLTPTAVIGAHKFYRFPSRSIEAAAPTAM